MARRISLRGKVPFINVHRSNSTARGKPLEVGEIVALSSYPGTTGAERSELQATMHRLTSQATSRVILSPWFNPAYDSKRDPLVKYQAAGVAYVLAQADRGQNRTAIFDPQGLGKTRQAVGSIIALGNKALPAVVVAPLATLPGWEETFKLLSAIPVYGAKERGLDPGVIAERMRSGEPAIYLTHYGKFSNIENSHFVRKVASDEKPFFPNFGMLVLDEAHALIKPTSLRTKVARYLIDKSNYTLLMTATPALKSALDVLPLLKLMERDNKGNYSPFETLEQWKSEAQHWADEVRARLTGRDEPDIEDPEDARKLEKRIRRVAARRSRKLVRDRSAAPEEMLQPFKHRDLYLIEPDPAYENYSDFLFHLQRKAEDTRQFAKGRARRVFTGIETFTRLDAAIDALHQSLQREVKKHPTWDSFRDSATQLPEYRAVLRAARTAYMAIPEPPGQPSLRKWMGVLTANAAPAIQEQYLNNDLIFVTFLLENADLLARNLSGAAPGRDVYLYTGTDKTIYRNGEPLNKRITSKDLQHAFRVEKPERGKPYRPKSPFKTAILTRTAQAGINLPSANYLFMLDRDYSPALEEQMEDRINRAGRVGESKIVYVMPRDVYSFALAHRLENRRLSISSSMNETFEDAYTEPLDLRKHLQDQFDEWAGSSDSDDNARAKILQTLLFTERPKAYIRETFMRKLWSLETRRRHEEEKKVKGQTACVIKIREGEFDIADLHQVYGFPRCSNDPEKRFNIVQDQDTEAVIGVMMGTMKSRSDAPNGNRVLRKDGVLIVMGEDWGPHPYKGGGYTDEVIRSLDELTPIQVEMLRAKALKSEPGKARLNPEQLRSRKPRRRRRRS